jgi:hypothetical protein
MLDNLLYAVRLACSLQMFLLWHYEFAFFWFLLQDVAPSRLVRSTNTCLSPRWRESQDSLPIRSSHLRQFSWYDPAIQASSGSHAAVGYFPQQATVSCCTMMIFTDSSWRTRRLREHPVRCSNDVHDSRGCCYCMPVSRSKVIVLVSCCACIYTPIVLHVCRWVE